MTIRKLSFLGILAASFILPAIARADRIDINIGDRGYYTHGGRYWDGDWEMIWVPGHREHGHWVHGYYRRGEHRHHHGDWHDDHHDDHHDR